MTYEIQKSIKYSSQIRCSNGKTLYLEYDSVVGNLVGCLNIEVRGYNGEAHQRCSVNCGREELQGIFELFKSSIEQKEAEKMEQIL